MVLEFKEEQITKRESWTWLPYVGYFSPRGELIGYNIMFGSGCHDDFRNPVSAAFLSFISYMQLDTSIEELKGEYIVKLCPNIVKENQYPGTDLFVKRGCSPHVYNERDIDYFLAMLDERYDYLRERQIKYGPLNGYALFEYDLLTFFKNAYKNKTFFETIGQTFIAPHPHEIEQSVKDYYNKSKLSRSERDYYIEREFRLAYKTLIMSFAKDIFVQYLGYDALERITPSIEAITFSSKSSFNFARTPRIITSSCSNPNERFFNYLVMDWQVSRVPKYNYDPKEERYIKELSSHPYFQTDRERQFEDEIEYIRKRVPIDERYKYFR